MCPHMPLDHRPIKSILAMHQEVIHMLPHARKGSHPLPHVRGGPTPQEGGPTHFHAPGGRTMRLHVRGGGYTRQHAPRGGPSAHSSACTCLHALLARVHSTHAHHARALATWLSSQPHISVESAPRNATSDCHVSKGIFWEYSLW